MLRILRASRQHVVTAAASICRCISFSHQHSGFSQDLKNLIHKPLPLLSTLQVTENKALKLCHDTSLKAVHAVKVCAAASLQDIMTNNAWIQIFLVQ